MPRRAVILAVLAFGASLLSMPRASLAQHGAHGSMGLATTPDVAPAVLGIENDAEREELVVTLGPIALPSGASHHNVQQPAVQRVALPIGGWLHGFHVEIVDGEGSPVDRRVLHHVNIIAPGRRELFSGIMQRVAAAGHETPPVELPRLVGYPIEAGDTLLVAAMFHNPTDREYPEIHLRVRMPYTPSDTWIPPISVQPFYLDVMPPASGHAYDLPPGRSSMSWEGSPAVDGRILGMGSHLHRYGVELRLEDMTQSEVLWRAKPAVNERGDVIGMPTETFFWTLGIPVYTDRVYRLTAVYDNPTGEMIPLGAMGALGGIMLPAQDALWPAADSTDPEYQLDLRLVTEGAYSDRPMGQGGHQGHH